VEQIVAAVEQNELSTPVAEITRKAEIAEKTVCRWKKQYRGLETSKVGKLSNCARRTAG